MHNNSKDLFADCHECEEMTRMDGSPAWGAGLLAKFVSLTLLAVLTTTANGVLLYVSYRTKSRIANTKVFFASLCSAHMIGSLVVTPFWIATSLRPELTQDSPLFCQSASFFWTLMILASFYSLSALSLDRYFIISNPMRYPVKATKPRKMIIVSLLWVVCILFAAAPILGWGEYKFMPDAIPLCGLNMKGSLSFTVFLIAAGFGLPIIIDIFCCGRIISIARRQYRSIDSRKSSDGSASTTSTSSSSSSDYQPHAKMSRLKQKLNSLRLVFAGTGSFLVCWLPYLTAHIWMTTVRNISHAEESMPYILEFVVMCVALLNGLINPVVLMLSNRDHRREIRRVLFTRFGWGGSSGDDAWDADSDSLTMQTRRTNNFRHSSTLSNTFQTINEMQLGTLAVPTETQQLKKQDSTASVEPSKDHGVIGVTVSNIQTTLIDRRQEVKRLISQNSVSSMDSEPETLQVKVQFHVDKAKKENVLTPTNELNNNDIVLNNNEGDPENVIK